MAEIEHTAENDAPRRHVPGCVLDPDHGAGCVRQQWATSDPEAPWNRDVDAIRAAMRYPECHEEVTRKGESQPCEAIAVAVRIDPNEGGLYPVCSRHTRRPMVRLSDLAATTKETA